MSVNYFPPPLPPSRLGFFLLKTPSKNGAQKIQGRDWRVCGFRALGSRPLKRDDQMHALFARQQDFREAGKKRSSVICLKAIRHPRRTSRSREQVGERVGRPRLDALRWRTLGRERGRRSRFLVTILVKDLLPATPPQGKSRRAPCFGFAPLVF